MTYVPVQKRYTGAKPNLVIAHPKNSLADYPFSIPEYRESYTDFCRLASNKFAIYYVRNRRRYLGRGVFAEGYVFRGSQFVPYPHRIYAAVVYNKTGLRVNGGRDWRAVNPWSIYRITSNKFRSYQLFREYMKPTFRVRSPAEVRAAVAQVRTAWAVYKPIRGAEGKGIIIRPKLSILPRLKKINGIIQEFIDTSDGVPGICRTLHDLRILIMSGRVVQTYVRIPKVGSYLANVARGGHLKEITLRQVPSAALRIARAIDRDHFRQYGPRVYAIDFGFERGKPYLFEINAQPGLPYKSWRRYYRVWHRQLLKTLWSAVQ
ncbi:MAG: hypothetical protein V1916_00635 [Patescibacteria group bacterium]